MIIKRGQLVEFTDQHYRNDPPDSARRFGVCTEDTDISVLANSPDVPVKTADGSIVRARHLLAYAWAGWMPSDLETVYMELNPETYSDEDEY